MDILRAARNSDYSFQHFEGEQARQIAAAIPCMLLQRNLIYTAITRGKKLVVLVGQRKVLEIAVRNDRPQKRYSGLLASVRG